MIASIKGHRESVCELAISNSGTWLASSGWDYKLKLWKCSNGKLTEYHSINCEDYPAYSFSFNSIDRAFAYVNPDRKSIQFFAIDKGKKIPTVLQLKQESGRVPSSPVLAFSHDGKTFAIASTHDASVELWKYPVNQEKPIRLGGNSNTVELLKFSRDSPTIASATSDRSIRVWEQLNNMTPKHAVITIPDKDYAGMLDLAFSKEGNELTACYAVGLGTELAVLRYNRKTQKALTTR